MHAAIQSATANAVANPAPLGRAAAPPAPPAPGLRPAGAIRRGVHGQPAAVPFATAAHAWFWTMAALIARRDGASRRSGGRSGVRVVRPCDPDDVIRALDLLYRRGGIGPAHARVLRRWGERFQAPLGHDAAAQADIALWQEAMERLEGVLRAKGIVAGSVNS